MLNYIFKLVNVLSLTHQYLCSKFYVQFVISTVKSRQISNIHMHVFLSKCKNHLILPADKSKSPKKNPIKTLSWNYCMALFHPQTRRHVL